MSLAREVDGLSLTGTIIFQSVPYPLRTGKSWQIRLSDTSKDPSARRVCLVLDDNFLGLTTLFAPAPEDHKVDVVAISGLGGHAFGSFKERGGEHMWLRDGLPHDLTGENTGHPMARLITYGYASGIANSTSMQNLEDLATSFHASLLQLASSPTTRSIIFIAHSLGGLIVKQTLITLSKSKNEEDEKLVRAVYGITFFGVPHDGMDIESLVPMVGDGPNRFLVESINRINSQILSLQRRDFLLALGKEGETEVVCFYETIKSPTAQKNRKTQVALAYVYWLQEVYPDVSVFWVHASNAERFRQSFLHIAQECQIPGHDSLKADLLSLVKFWLGKKGHGRWLMVIDNADDTELFFGRSASAATAMTDHSDGSLAHYIPECAHGRILVTTRNKQAGSRLTKGHQPIEVGRMDEEESYHLLRTRLEDADSTVAALSALTTRLEGLPLALVQATAFIQENCITIDDYLKLLDQGNQSLVDLLSEEFETVGRDSETPRAVAETWMLSFQQISQQNELAGQLLSVMSLFDCQGIPMVFLSHYSGQERNGGPRSELELTKSLGVLKAFCLITEEKSGSLDVHRLVHLVTRKWLQKEGRISQFERDALSTVSNTYPFGCYENRTVCAEYLPHATAVLKVELAGSDDGANEKASLLHCVSGYLDFEGKWKDAEMLLGRGSRMREEVLGKEHPDTLNRRWKEAEQLQEGVMETRKRVLGDEHPDTLTSMSNLASTYSNQGRWAEAEQLEVGVMETTKRVLGDEHPSTLSSMDNLALTYQNQGRWKEAEQLGVRVMDTRKRVLSDEHPSTLTSMANLASTYQYQGRWKEAEQLQAGVMELMKRVLSDEHPHTLSSMSNLASTYSNQGRWAEAEQLQVGVMETTKRVLGDEHPSTLSSMNNLASTYWNQGRWKEAEQLQVGVMELMRRVLGAEHPSTLTSMANLASTYSNQGRWAEAEQLEVGVMETTKRVLGDEHPHTLRSMSNLASTYSNQGRWKEAEQLGVRVMDTRKRVLSDEHPDTLTSMANLASTYSNQGRWKEAEQLEVGVMELMQRVLGDEHSDTLTSMANLAWTLHDLGCYVDAQVLMEHCSRLRRKTLGDNHPHTRSSVMTLTSWQRNVAVAETSVVD
ncbi:hypothetical protein ACHAQA_010095 [Verticillium albo-atrum]